MLLFVNYVNKKYEPNYQPHTQIAQYIDAKHKYFKWEHVISTYGCSSPRTYMIKVHYQSLQKTS